MADFPHRVRQLSHLAWRIRRSAPRPCRLPVALALFTDDRRHPDIISLLERLPAAPHVAPLLVVFRHDGLGAAREAVAGDAKAIVHARGHFFFMARAALAGADGVHGGDGTSATGGWRSRPIHTIREAHRANGLGTTLGFVSPVFSTRSHPDAPALGVMKANSVASALMAPAFALGGVDLDSGRLLVGSGFQGIGAIGAFGDVRT